MIFVVDTDSTRQNYEQLTTFEGVQYLLRFWWSDREAAWYLDINDHQGNPLALFIRLNVSWSLLRRFKVVGLPPGVLLCLDQTGKDRDITTPAELGTRVLLLYVTSDDPSLAVAAP